MLQSDAYTDLREEYVETPVSHARVMRRAMEATDRTVAVGRRSVSAGERELSRDGRPTVVCAEKLRSDSEPMRRVAGGGRGAT